MNVFRGQAGALLSRWEAIRESYWFIPMLMAAGAAALAIGLVELDATVAGARARRLPWIQDTGPEGTRALLSAVASSTITVTGVVFSITIVALTLASSQFGPRLLRNFLRDRGNQLVLGTFVATFLYSLLVLRAVEADRVPYLATAAAVALALTSVFVLIYFVHHAASSIQASSIIASVAAEIDRELPSLFPEELGSGTGDAERSPPHGLPDLGCREVCSEASGYLRVLDSEGILQLAVDHDLCIELSLSPGDFVPAGARIARYAPGRGSDDEIACGLRACFALGTHRSAVQDLAFLTDQLAEMAVRALSPGINDPNTAIACIHRIGVVLTTVARRKMPSSDRYDGDGVLRVLARPTTFGMIVSSCLDPLRRHAAADAEVVAAALEALAGAIRRCPEAERRALLVEHAREWAEGFGQGASPSKREQARVERALEAFLRDAAGAERA